MLPAFATGAALFVGGYLVLLAGLGIAARRARRGESLGDFYLAGRDLGAPVLLLTLYATQYSGNSLLGYPGEAYRVGYPWIMSIGFLMAVPVVYLMIAPRLQRMARAHGFVTPGDFLDHRFRSPALSLAANSVMALAIANYLLAQLMAMGHVTSASTSPGRSWWRCSRWRCSRGSRSGV